MIIYSGNGGSNTYPIALSTTNSIMTALRAKPSLRSEEPATERLNCGMTQFFCYMVSWFLESHFKILCALNNS